MPSTIADVAARAGVSTATVSRVLAGLGRASPATRDRVLEAARDLDYRPSGIARSLKRRQTRTLGLIVTDIENPFFPQLVRVVEDAAREAGYAVLLCNAADDPEREADYLDLLVERRVDGVVIAAASLGRRHQEWLRDPPIPVVVVNGLATAAGVPAIASDNRAGGRLAVEHLLQLGHRRLGYLMAGPRNADAPDRRAGAVEALVAAGMAPASLAVATDDAVVTGGERAMRSLLASAPEVTGVFAYNDLMAIGAIRAARALGRRVPEDLSVVGFDDVDIAAYVEPPLTTVVQAIPEMGRWAFQALAHQLGIGTDGEGDPPTGADGPRLVRLPVSLRVRGSTAPPPLP